MAPGPSISSVIPEKMVETITSESSSRQSYLEKRKRTGNTADDSLDSEESGTTSAESTRKNKKKPGWQKGKPRKNADHTRQASQVDPT